MKRYEHFCSYDGGGPAVAEESLDGEFVRYADAQAEIERLRADAARWRTLYRRAVNEANGLANYVEDRPELRRSERNLAAIETDAAAIDAAMKGKT